VNSPIFGAIFFAVYGALWFALGALFGGLSYNVVQLVTLGIALTLIVALIVKIGRRTPAVRPKLSSDRGRGRTFGIINAVQFVIIFIAINVATNLHRSDLVPAAIELVVGVHFLPLARILNVWTHYIVGSLMLVCAASALAQHGTIAIAIACVSSGSILWGAAAYALVWRSRVLASN